MDAQRRSEIAERGRKLLPELHRAVVDSWPDLLPAAATWSPQSARRARRAALAALEGILRAIEQGDVSDRAWKWLRDEVFVHEKGGDDTEQLVRSVRVVGVETLAGSLAATIGLSHDERWQLQREASGFCEALLGIHEELDPAAYDALLAELQRSGPDLR